MNISWTLPEIFLAQTLIGLIYDHIIGDPYWFPHPARHIGKLITLLEKYLRQKFHDRLLFAGFILCAAVTFASAFITFIIFLAGLYLDKLIFKFDISSASTHTPWFTILSGGTICGIWFSFKSLSDEAEKIRILLCDGKLAEARKELSMIVGRDTENLTEEQISRATIESIAESSIDGGLSPLFFSVIGGPILVSFFKAASTLDSMVGYRNEKYILLGKASAKLDDILNYIPARLGFIIIPAAAAILKMDFLSAIKTGIQDGQKHPSPNSAISESIFAGALSIQLGGPSTYNGVLSDKSTLGEDKKDISAADIKHAQSLLFTMKLVTAIIIFVALLYAFL